MAAVPGTQGYAENAAELIERYETLPFTAKHEIVLSLLPAAPCAVLDIGAGTGIDAAWLAARGHTVLAVEPTAALRNYGIAHHPSPGIEWLDDSLPDLEHVRGRGMAFGLVMLTAVWMHLDEQQRRRAMPLLASLVATDGLLVMAIRRGPVPAGRVMFEVPVDETVALATAQGLQGVLDAIAPSRSAANREAGVTWSRLAFRRAVSA